MGIAQVPAGIAHFRTLGLDPSAGSEAIRGAYRSLARKLHPDVSGSPDTAEAMRQANVACEALLSENPPSPAVFGLIPARRILTGGDPLAPYRRTMTAEGDRPGRLIDIRA